MFSIRTTVICAAFAILVTGCNKPTVTKSEDSLLPSVRPAQPTNNDVKVASHAMNIDDVVQMLKKGEPQESIIAEVKKRHIVATIVDANELQLLLYGARRPLISALKDKNNRLTEAQEQAYMKLRAERQIVPFAGPPIKSSPK